MALIKCPECGGEVSDKAEVCIHCGFPIQKTLKEDAPYSTEVDAIKDILRDVEKDTEIEQLGKNVSFDEHVQLLAEYGEKTKYWRAYYIAGLYYANMNLSDIQWNKSVEYFENALECERPDYDKTYAYLGRVKCFLANKCKSDSMFEDAIGVLKKANYYAAFSDLGDVYNPKLSFKFCYSQKDYEMAKQYYIKTVEKNIFDTPAGKLIGATALSNLAVLYGDNDNFYIRAAACAFLAKIYSNGKIGSNNYNVYISVVEKNNGPIWKSNIERLKKFEDINSMIERVNAEITEESQTVRCPRCGSTAVTTGARGYGGFWMNIGATQTVNRCAKCGKTWKPRLR